MFCSNCGSKISDSATFCSNCGKAIKRAVAKKKRLFTTEAVDIKSILEAIKKYFSDFFVDYNSSLFKFAMSLFFALGISDPLNRLIGMVFPSIYGFSARSLVDFSVFLILFALFAILIFKIRDKSTVKKSNILRVFWLVFTVLNVILFFADYNIFEYILWTGYIVPIVEMLWVISSVVLICKNKPKYPIALIVSLLSFSLINASKSTIDLHISIYKIWKTGEYFIKLFNVNVLGYIILCGVLFLLVYVLPRKISKWLIWFPSLFIAYFSLGDLIKNFSLSGVFNFIFKAGIIAMFVMFALCCSRKAKYDYIIENSERLGNDAIKVGVISAILVAVITTACLLSSALVCSAQINKGIEAWKGKITSNQLTSDVAWQLMEKDIFKYSSDKLVSSFVDEYSFYQNLDKYRHTLRKISTCYYAYKYGTVNENIAETYSSISVDDGLLSYSPFSSYCEQYTEMMPKDDNVSAEAYVNVEKGKIDVTVTNKNVFPIASCKVKCKFTILFIESGSYSNTEYGRGERIIEVEEIKGNSESKKTISFDPDEYYDSYGSYIMATLFNSSEEIISIEK